MEPPVACFRKGYSRRGNWKNTDAVGNAEATASEVGDRLRSSSTNRRNHTYQGERFKHWAKIKNRHAPGNYGTSLRLAPGGLFKKKSRLPVAASAYWSMATMIA
jgi:hypothetical protein